MARPWMPLYVGDYRRDTAHLSALEHGAYLLLIMHYWQAGELPADDRQLSRIAACTPAEWRRIKPTIQAFFSDGWKHARIEFELTETARISEAGRKGGIASGEARRAAKQNRTTVQRPFNDRSTIDERPSERPGNETPSPSQPPSQPPSQVKQDSKIQGPIVKGVKYPRHGATTEKNGVRLVYFKRGTKEFEAYSEDYQAAKGELPEATDDGRWFRLLGETNFLDKKKGAA